jgi:FkbM family methyltransferase
VSRVGDSVARAMKARTKQLARAAGFDVRRVRELDSHGARRQRLLERHGIGLVLDVGANVGNYAETLRSYGYAGRIVSIEPGRAAFEQLERRARRDAGWECIRAALGAREGHANLHISKTDECSSLLALEPRVSDSAPSWRYVGDELVTLRQLDLIAAEVARPGERLWLKLDVQGFELNVLKGAAGTLPRIDAIETELLLEPLYEGQPSLPEMVQFLADAGFALTSVDSGYVHRESGQTMFLDGIFLRRTNGSA